MGWLPGTVSVWLDVEPLPSSCRPSHTTVTSACDIDCGFSFGEEEPRITARPRLPHRLSPPLRSSFLSVSLHLAGIRMRALSCGEAPSDIPAETTDVAVHPPRPNRPSQGRLAQATRTQAPCVRARIAKGPVYLREVKGSLPHQLSCNGQNFGDTSVHVWVCVCVSLLTRDFTCSVGTSHYFTASFFFLGPLDFIIKFHGQDLCFRRR